MHNKGIIEPYRSVNNQPFYLNFKPYNDIIHGKIIDRNKLVIRNKVERDIPRRTMLCCKGTSASHILKV